LERGDSSPLWFGFQFIDQKRLRRKGKATTNRRTPNMPRVFIPPLLRSLTDDQDALDVDGATVGEVIDSLNRQFPGVQERLVQDGRLRPGLSVAIGTKVSARGLLSKTAPGDEVHFLPAIGGG
jgi:molybdopterin converting factor small subunit